MLQCRHHSIGAIHKLAAGMTGCLSAKAAGNRCDAATIGAVVGEMWGDYQVNHPNTKKQTHQSSQTDCRHHCCLC